jgi:hypothetical protein
MLQERNQQTGMARTSTTDITTANKEKGRFDSK